MNPQFQDNQKLLQAPMTFVTTLQNVHRLFVYRMFTERLLNGRRTEVPQQTLRQ
jgi:hypothetical protein